MLTRYQVLLPDWMEDYIKFVAEKYDLNTSSTIRVHLCLAIISVIRSLHPEYKPNLSGKELKDLSKKASKNNLDDVEIHRVFSKVLFEARKAVEYRFAKEKRAKKK